MLSALTISAQGPRATECRRLMTLAWAVVLIFFIMDVVWFPFARLTFASGNALQLLGTALALVAVYAAVGLVSARVKDDASLIGRSLAHIAEGAGLLIGAATFTIALGIVGVIFSYLTASLGLPLRDADLDAIDRAMGFDWPSFLAFASASPMVAAILRTAYHTAGPQLIAVYLFLSFVRWPERLAEFLAILAVASLLTGLVVALVPADDGYAVYAPAPELYGSFSANAGMWRHDILMSLRASAEPVFEFAKAEGIVVFPSFHTTLAIITPYAVRGVRYLFLPVAALNAVVIVATVPEGGHHLIDLIGGALVAVAAILAVRYWAKRGWVPGRAAAPDFA